MAYITMRSFRLFGVCLLCGSYGYGYAQSIRKPIVILGSSTAVGKGASTTDSSWVGRYARYLGAQTPPIRVVNLAISGGTTFHILPSNVTIVSGRAAPDINNNITKAISLGPMAIIVNMPSNDTRDGVPVAQQQHNYEILAETARNSGVPLFICTAQPRNTLDSRGRSDQVIMMNWVLARFGSHAIDFWHDVTDGEGLMLEELDSGDGVHLNDVGHAILFNRVLAAGAHSSATLHVRRLPPHIPFVWELNGKRDALGRLLRRAH